MTFAILLVCYSISLWYIIYRLYSCWKKLQIISAFNMSKDMYMYLLYELLFET